MSAENFRLAAKQSRLPGNDAAWCPRWIEQYRKFHRRTASQRLEVDRENVVAFLADLKQRGRPAWTRLQAARAIDAYRTLVLKSDEVNVSDID